jgi:hypothetical protein
VIAQHVGIVPYNNPVFRLMMRLANRVVVRPMLARADQIAFFSEITARYFSGTQFRHKPELMFTGVDTDVYFPVGADQKPELRRGPGSWVETGYARRTLRRPVR